MIVLLVLEVQCAKRVWPWLSWPSRMGTAWSIEAAKITLSSSFSFALVFLALPMDFLVLLNEPANNGLQNLPQATVVILRARSTTEIAQGLARKHQGSVKQSTIFLHGKGYILCLLFELVS
jgi:hypothetical protein